MTEILAASRQSESRRVTAHGIIIITLNAITNHNIKQNEKSEHQIENNIGEGISLTIIKTDKETSSYGKENNYNLYGK